MEGSEVDLAFSILPPTLRRRIDLAFDNAVASSNTLADGPSRKKHKTDFPAVGGGFIPEAENSAAPGGFIIEDIQPGGFIADDPSDGEGDAHLRDTLQIPLSLIPIALQLLDLQPDDEDVLAVFNNAASGWDGSTTDRSGQEQYVSRKDWRAVCAALLDVGDANAISVDEDGVDVPHSRDESSASEDEYREQHRTSSSVMSGEASDDDYQDTSFNIQSKSKRSRTGVVDAKSRSTRKRPKTADLDVDFGPSGSSQRITPRQRSECRRTFALFFPGIDDEDLDRQKLMIKDITRAAQLLKEKITAEEIVEMLELFSTSPDKSMNLGDFEKMMLMAKLA